MAQQDRDEDLVSGPHEDQAKEITRPPQAELVR
jgi:hypothetical protein